jgi:hypothetical protein
VIRGRVRLTPEHWSIVSTLTVTFPAIMVPVLVAARSRRQLNGPQLYQGACQTLPRLALGDHPMWPSFLETICA